MNGSALLIYGAIIIIAVLAFWTIIWKQLCSPVWKTIYILIGTGILAFAVYSGYYVIHNSVFTERVETSAKAVPKTPSKASSPVEIISSVESYKAAYELFNSQFSQLLTFLGIFGTIFGLVIPAGAYLLQKQSIKEEMERLQKYIDSTEQRLKEIDKKQKDHFLSEGTSFHAVIALAFFILQDTKDPHKLTHILHIILISFDNAVNCATKAHDSIALYNIMSSTLDPLEKFLISVDRKIFEDAISGMKKAKIIRNDPHFVSGDEILDVLGYHNEDLFLRYRKIYIQIYSWKFNGQQKKA